MTDVTRMNIQYCHQACSTNEAVTTLSSVKVPGSSAGQTLTENVLHRPIGSLLIVIHCMSGRTIEWVGQLSIGQLLAWQVALQSILVAFTSLLGLITYL